MFKPGDKIERKDGYKFSHGDRHATINRIEYIDECRERAWLKETGTFVSTRSIRKVNLRNIGDVKQTLEEELEKAEQRVTKIKHTIELLNELEGN